MANEVTDCGNNEQFIICFRLVDDHDTQGFDTHEDFLGIYNGDNMKADNLVTVIKKVLITLSGKNFRLTIFGQNKLGRF